MTRLAIATVSLWLSAAACREGPAGTETDAAADAAPCVDDDLDSHFDIACGGDDCDDSDPAIHAREDCLARCEMDSHAAGCACTADLAEDCYSGPPGTAGVGECTAGSRRCEDGVWTACEGERVPHPHDACDLRDEDCDGEVDEENPPDRWCGCSFCDFQCLGQDCPQPLADAEWRGLVPSDVNEGCVTLAPGAVAGSLETIFDLAYWFWSHVDASATTPERTALAFSYRMADDAGGLANAPWRSLGSLPADPLPFRIPDAERSLEWLAVRVDFQSDGVVAPELCALAAVPERSGE